MLLDAVTSAANVDIPGWFVVVMGLGIVFFGLICIILIITIMGAIMKAFAKVQPKKVAAPVNVPAAQPQTTEIPNRSEFVAAVAAVIAEELGTDITKIRIESIKKL